MDIHENSLSLLSEVASTMQVITPNFQQPQYQTQFIQAVQYPLISSSGTADKRKIPEIYCSGINYLQISNYANINDATRSYCSNHFGFLKRKWRSNDCDLRICNTSLSSSGWRMISGEYICRLCMSVKKNLNRHQCIS